MLGSKYLGDNLTFSVRMFATATHAAANADANPSYRVYEDETATPIATGTLTALDAANTTGLYSEQIAVTTGNGFEEGRSYTVYVEAVVATVVETFVFHFEVETRASIATALLDLVDGIETGYTLRQALRLIAAAVAGKVSGAPGSPVHRNLPDTANRISATADANGNRSVVTHTP